MVVDGEPGLGKSAMVHWWAVQTGAVFLRAKKEWTPRWMLRELLQELRVTPDHSFEKMYRRTLTELGDRARLKESEDGTFAVMIDEADHICRRGQLLETLRDLSDLLEIPFILVGMGRIRDSLVRFPQVASRIGQLVEFKAASLYDVRHMVATLCEVPVKEELVALLHQAAQGRFREVKEGIKSIERVGLRNKGREMGLAEMAGRVLLNDRRTGQPITLRAA